MLALVPLTLLMTACTEETAPHTAPVTDGLVRTADLPGTPWEGSERSSRSAEGVCGQEPDPERPQASDSDVVAWSRSDLDDQTIVEEWIERYPGSGAERAFEAMTVDDRCTWTRDGLRREATVEPSVDHGDDSQVLRIVNSQSDSMTYLVGIRSGATLLLLRLSGGGPDRPLLDAVVDGAWRRAVDAGVVDG
jgi:hypothetical protein